VAVFKGLFMKYVSKSTVIFTVRLDIKNFKS